MASGICIQLMAELYNIKHGGTNIENLNSLVSRVKNLMYNNINKSVDQIKTTKVLSVSYSKFRLDFKKQTGISPLQYYLK